MAKKKTVATKAFPKATEKDFDVIFTPVITEKTMALIQNQNKVTVKVAPTSNKTEIKGAFQRIFQVHVTDVKVANVGAKEKSRGSRYTGSVPGYKKAIVTVASGEAIDLFRE